MKVDPHNPYVVNGVKGWPPHFRVPNGALRKAVRGGRWKVRKLKFNPKTPDLLWRAFSTGKASYFNRNFRTQEEAIAWAQDIAHLFTLRLDNPDRVGLYLVYQREKYPNIKRATQLTHLRRFGIPSEDIDSYWPDLLKPQDRIRNLQFPGPSMEPTA